MINAKKKGNAGENKWANWLTDQGIKCYRNSSSGATIQKSDVHNGINANFEVKTVKKINLRKAWRQSKRDADMTHSTPYLVIHLDGMPENDWLIVMDNWSWVEMLKKSLEEQQITPTDDRPQGRELKWALHNLKVAAAKVDKLLESYPHSGLQNGDRSL